MFDTAASGATGDVRIVPVLGAPTASGKSALALALAERLPLEVVSADAMQVYRGMDVGTAKPGPAERARVPHHLIDVVDPDAAFSVADWVARAEAAIAGVWGRGRVPFVVGGTGFYIRALRRGLPTAPAADPGAQAPLWEAVAAGGLERLVAELRAASPEDAARAGRNPRRVVRAVEILRRSGRPPAAFPFTRPAFRYAVAVLLPSLAALRPRIEARVDAMFDAGLVDEVRALRARYPDRPTATQAIGYGEVVAHLEGRVTLAEARARVVTATAQYARRQRTWFRKEPAQRRWEALAGEVAGEVEAWLGGGIGSWTRGRPRRG